MLVRVTALVFALLVWVQTVLPGGMERVCRFTGRRAAPCAACPEKKDGPRDARLLAQDCCELRQGHPADVRGVPPTAEAPPGVSWVELPERHVWSVPVAPSRPGPRSHSGQDPPPRERLFLALRQWLI